MGAAPLTELQDGRVQVELRVYCEHSDPKLDGADEAQAIVHDMLQGGAAPEPPARAPHYRTAVHLLVPVGKFDEVRRVHFTEPPPGPTAPRCHCDTPLSRSIVYHRLPVDLGATT